MDDGLDFLTRRGLLAAALLLATSIPGEAAQTPEAFVGEVGSHLVAAAQRNAPPAFYERLLTRYADTAGLAERAAGPWYRQLRRSNYTALTTRYVAQLIAGNQNRFAGERFAVIARQGAGVVQGQVQFGNGRNVTVLFQLVRAGGGWRLADINAQGLWLSGILAGNFRQIIADGGGNPQSLIQFLQTGEIPVRSNL